MSKDKTKIMNPTFIKNSVLTSIILLLAITTHAQETLTLDECVRLAKENNLSIKSGLLNENQAAANYENAKWQWTPSINASANQSFLFGLTLNPTTNNLESANSNTTTFGVSARASIFANGRLKNNIKANKYSFEASKADNQQLESDIILQTVNAYINAVFEKERIQIAKSNVEQSEAQLNQLERLISAGVRPEIDKLQLEAQLASDLQQEIASQNNYDIALLNLQNILFLEENYFDNLEIPNLDFDINDPIYLTPFNEIFDKAILSYASLKSSDLNIKASEMRLKVQKTNKLPSLFAFGNMDTRYSSLARDFSLPNTPTRKFNDQINNNLGQSVGLSLNIPIYNRTDNKLSEQQATINIKRAEIQREQAIQQLKTDVLSAYTSLKSNRFQYEAAQKTENANLKSFEAAQKQFEIGAIDAISVQIARTNHNNSKVQTLIAKYNLILSQKVLHFYVGNQITLE